jgi:HSP20 family protein
MSGQLTTSRTPLTPWLRRGPFAQLRHEMEGLLERIWDGDGSGLSTELFVPPLDLSETDAAVQVRVDLPGVEAKEIDVQVRDNQLVITGERKEEKEEKGETFHRMERSEGRFSRSVLLPCGVKTDKIDAEFRNGVLTVTLPKTEQAKAKRVEIKAT